MAAQHRSPSSKSRSRQSPVPWGPKWPQVGPVYIGPQSKGLGPSTQYLRTLVPKAIKGRVFGTRVLKYWVLGISGTITRRPERSVPECMVAHVRPLHTGRKHLPFPRIPWQSSHTTWLFPYIGVSLLWVSLKKSPTIWGLYWGGPFFQTSTYTGTVRIARPELVAY